MERGRRERAMVREVREEGRENRGEEREEEGDGERR